MPLVIDTTNLRRPAREKGEDKQLVKWIRSSGADTAPWSVRKMNTWRVCLNRGINHFLTVTKSSHLPNAGRRGRPAEKIIATLCVSVSTNILEGVCLTKINSLIGRNRLLIFFRFRVVLSCTKVWNGYGWIVRTLL